MTSALNCISATDGHGSLERSGFRFALDSQISAAKVLLLSTIVSVSEGHADGVCRCAEDLSEQQATAFLEAAAGRLSSEEAPVQAGALRCIQAVVDHASPALLHRSVGQLYQGEDRMSI